MINKNSDDSGSTKNENGMESVSEFIQENKFTTCVFSIPEFTCIKTPTANIKEASMEVAAIVPDKPLLIFFPKNPLIKKPINGKSGIKPINFIILSIYNLLIYDFEIYNFVSIYLSSFILKF